MSKEGRRIKSGSPMDMATPFLMPDRSGASNLFSASVNVEKCERLLREKRLEGMKGLGMIHIFMAAYIRTVSQVPGINRYIRGQRIYARNGKDICMAIKKEMPLYAPESVVKLDALPTDTLYTVYENLTNLLEINKKEGDNNNMDVFVRLLMKLPAVLLKFTIWFVKFLDYFGLLPRWLTRLSPFHGSMFITNMGSLGMPPIFHHLYDFGNLPLFIAMGKKRTEYLVNKEGQVETRRMIDFTVTCDERICDGHYYASAFKVLKKILENPEQLLTPPENTVEDIK